MDKWKSSDSEPIEETTLRGQLVRYLENAPLPMPKGMQPSPPFRTLLPSEGTDEERRFLETLVHNAPEGIVVLTPGTSQCQSNVVFVNEGFCRMTGMSRAEVIGETPQIFRVAEVDHAVMDALQHPLCQRKGFEGEAIAFRKNGSRFAMELLVIPVKEANEELRYWIAYMRDVSERKAQLAALEHQALHDVLTDLPNRVLLRDRLEQSLLSAGDDGSMVALFVIDVEEFKEINEAFGYHFGDLLLQQIGPRLRKHLRPLDTVARMSGDSFAVLLPALTDGRDAMKIAQKLHKTFQTPFKVGDRNVEVGASIGIAVFPEHGNDSTSILRAAEMAVVTARELHSGFSLYTPEQHRPTTESVTLKLDLREAIEDNQLVLYYQPKVHLKSGLVTRVEALVRWRHPERGLVLPDQFIPLAERTDLIKNLTDWVLESALKQVKDWQRQGLPLYVAVNLSTHSLQEPFLPERISRLLEKWDVEPRMLKLEITESSILADPPHVLAILALLRTLGVKLSLDDFGTGYSSLVHLRQLPVDEIKIDKSFVMGMRSNKSDVAIVKAMIHLAHDLGYEVVAEGVDDEDTFRTLSDLGCDLAQGYYLSPPLTPEDLGKWLNDSQWGLASTRTLREPRRKKSPASRPQL